MASKISPVFIVVILAASSEALVPKGNAFGTAVGGGLDFRLAPVLGWRVQGDYLQTHLFHNTQNNVRLSTGLVLRF